MSGMVDLLLVAGALALSIGYAALALGPKAWRQRWARLRGKESGAGACGGCDNCGDAAAQSGSAPAKEGEVRVPVERIGRRG